MRTLIMSYAVCAVMSISTARAAGDAPAFSPTYQDDKTFSESWTTVAILPDETVVHAGMLISNAGLSSGKASCNAQIFDTKGKVWSGDLMADRDAWSYSDAYGLRIGACSLQQHDGETVLHMPFKSGTLKITYHDVPKPTQMPDAVHNNDRFYDSRVLIPFGKVSVVYPGHGGKSRSATGQALLDHTRSTTLPRDVGYGWLRFRGFSPKCSRIVLTRYVTPAQGASPAKLQSTWWKEGDAAPAGIKAPSIALPAVDTPADKLKATMFDGSEKLFTVRGKRRLWKSAPFKENGMLGRLVGAFVGDVVMEAFVATMEEPGDGPCKEVTGLLELDHFES